MPATTTRLALPYPLGTDTPNTPSFLQQLANALDTIVIKWQTGTLALRPSAGNGGFAYLATDQTGADGNLGQWYLDTGTQWILVNPQVSLASSVTSSAVGDASVVGTSTAAARADHQHGREAWAGSGGLYGNSASPARADHNHESATLLGNLVQTLTNASPLLSLSTDTGNVAIEGATSTANAYPSANISLGYGFNEISGTMIDCGPGNWLILGIAALFASNTTSVEVGLTTSTGAWSQSPTNGGWLIATSAKLEVPSDGDRVSGMVFGFGSFDGAGSYVSLGAQVDTEGNTVYAARNDNNLETCLFALQLTN